MEQTLTLFQVGGWAGGWAGQRVLGMLRMLARRGMLVFAHTAFSPLPTADCLHARVFNPCCCRTWLRAT